MRLRPGATNGLSENLAPISPPFFPLATLCGCRVHQKYKQQGIKEFEKKKGAVAEEEEEEEEDEDKGEDEDEGEGEDEVG